MAKSIYYWANYTHNEVKWSSKSENLVDSDHVLNFDYDVEARVVQVVQAFYVTLERYV
jgi:hypothetical protein